MKDGNGGYEKNFVRCVTMGLFHTWAGCYSIFSIHINPALSIALRKRGK